MGALGTANILSGLTQGYAVSSSSSRTAVNDSDGRPHPGRGGRSPRWSSRSCCCVLTAPVQYLPTACLGAVIIVAAAGLISPAAWRTLARVDRVEVGIAATTTAGVILVGVLQALVIACAAVHRRRGAAQRPSARRGPRLRREPRAVGGRALQPPGAPHARGRGLPPGRPALLRQRSYFKGRIRESVAAAPPPVHALVFDAESMNLVDSSGMAALAEVVSQLRAEGIGFCVARMHQPVMDDLERDGLVDLIGAGQLPPHGGRGRRGLRHAPSRSARSMRSSADDVPVARRREVGGLRRPVLRGPGDEPGAQPARARRDQVVVVGGHHHRLRPAPGRAGRRCAGRPPAAACRPPPSRRPGRCPTAARRRATRRTIRATWPLELGATMNRSRRRVSPGTVSGHGSRRCQARRQRVAVRGVEGVGEAELGHHLVERLAVEHVQVHPGARARADRLHLGLVAGAPGVGERLPGHALDAARAPQLGRLAGHRGAPVDAGAEDVEQQRADRRGVAHGPIRSADG